MTLNNKQRRELLDRARASGYEGSIIDVYQGHRQGRDVIAEFEAQKQGNIAVTPSQQQAGLGPAHQAGRTGESMVFPNIGPNATMTTANKGLKVNLDVKGYDDRGHLVKSYDSVPPGVNTLPMGPRATTVVETPARYKAGGRKDPVVGTGKKPKGSGRRLYTDENPKDTVSIKFATPADASATVSKVKNINKPFARKIQILTVGEQRAKVMGKSKVASIFKSGKESIRRNKRLGGFLSDI